METTAAALFHRQPGVSFTQRLEGLEKQLANQVIAEAGKQQTAHLQNKRVLLVEDDPVVQRVHHHYLQDMDYTIDVANSGKKALELYQPGKYCVVILDGGLPDTTGFDLAKIIRAQEIPNQRQYLILVSAFDYKDVKNKCAESDIDDFAIKPVKFETLETMISNAVKQISSANH
jgi:CheY-like chemotaxis protein